MNTSLFNQDFSRTTIVNAIRRSIADETWAFECGEHNRRGDETANPITLINRLLEIDELATETLFPPEADLSTGDRLKRFQSLIDRLNEHNHDGSLDKLVKDIQTIADKKRPKPNMLNDQLSALRLFLEYETGTINRANIKLSDYAINESQSATERYSNQVFLSYQFNDWLYTIGLFQMFRECGTYLFVDWMHNEKLNNGVQIKAVLHPEITNSSKFVLLPHYKLPYGKSEDASKVTAWCAWEIGVRHETSPQEKYLIDPSNGKAKYPDLLDTLKRAHKMGDFFLN